MDGAARRAAKMAVPRWLTRAIVAVMAGEVREQLQADLSSALKARDAVRTSVLRTTLALLANAEAVDPTGHMTPTGLFGDVARRQLSEAEVFDLIARERDELHESAAELRQVRQHDAAAELVAKAGILDGYLAPQGADRAV